MADDVVLNPGSSGDTIAADDIAGVKHQRVKIQHGDDGSATDVSTASPLPVGDAGGTLSVDDGGSTLSIDDGGGVVTVDGTVTVTQATASNLHAQVTIVDGNADPVTDDANNAVRVSLVAGGSVSISGNVTVAQATASNLNAQVQGAVAHDDGIGGNPVTTGGFGSAAAPVDVDQGDVVRQWHLLNGANVAQLSAAGALIGGDASNGLDVDVTRVPAPLSTVGNGTHNVAMRVTVASDSTGQTTITDGTDTVSVTSNGELLCLTTVGAGQAASDDPAGGLPVVAGGRGSATAPAAVDTNGDAVELWTSLRGALNVSIRDDDGDSCMDNTAAALRTQGTETIVDDAAFTPGTTRVVPMAGTYRTSRDLLDDNDAGAVAITQSRAIYATLETPTGSTVMDSVNNAVNATARGPAAHGAAVTGINPVLVGLEGRTTNPTAVDDGDVVRPMADALGKQIVLVGAPNGLTTRGLLNRTDDSAADVIAAAGAGVKIAVMGILVVNGHASVSTKVSVRDGTTAKVTGYAKADGGGFSVPAGSCPIFTTTANTAVTAICATTGSDVDIAVWGYLTP